jgi:hypothetical protein
LERNLRLLWLLHGGRGNSDEKINTENKILLRKIKWKKGTHRVAFLSPHEIKMHLSPPVRWFKLFRALRLLDALHEKHLINKHNFPLEGEH